MGHLDPVVQSFIDYGVALTILAIVILLLVLYFKKLIGQKTIIEKQLDENKTILKEVREDTIAIKIILQGGFRIKGLNDD